NGLLIDDMAIKHYRRFLDQYRKENDLVSPDETEKEIRYDLGRVYERKGLLDMALKEYQAIYEHAMKFRDIALKIPVLYEKKMASEQRASETDGLTIAQRTARPQEGQIRCPKCLNIIAKEVVYCPFCSCKVGFTETELAKQQERRKTRLTP